MFKNILVPIDLEHADKSKAMIEMARQLVDQSGGQMTLINVVPQMPPFVEVEFPSSLHEQLLESARVGLEKIAAEQKLPSSTTTKIAYGSPGTEIVKTAAEDEADLIIIASHQPGMSDYLLGSVAGRVVRHAHCTVMVLR